MKPTTFTAIHNRRNERGVALIIVLGFLGLMVMMAVAFMVQARVERMVADTTLEGMRARQLVQSGIAAALQDYVNASVEKLAGNEQPPSMYLSGSNYVSRLYNSDLKFGSTDFWDGEAGDWLPETLDPEIKLNDVKKMEWLWVRKDPQKRSEILGRYAYVCINLTGGVDANLLGRDYGEDLPARGYGATTNRNNVRKMFLNAISTQNEGNPSDDTGRQLKLAQYQAMWQGFDTPAALVNLTDGEFHDGKNKGRPGSSTPNRWAKLGMDEREVKGINTSGLSCYSYAATWNQSQYGKREECSFENIVKNPHFSSLITKMGGNEADVRKALEDYTTDFSSVVQLNRSLTDYPSVLPVPMFNEIKAEVALEQAEGSGKWQLKVTLEPEFWCPFKQQNNGGNFTLDPLQEIGGGMAQSGSGDIWIYGRVVTVDGPVNEATFSKDSINPSTLPVDISEQPKSPGKFEYILNIDGLERADGTTPELRGVQLRAINLQTPWKLLSGTTAVDATPKVLSFDFHNAAVTPSKSAVTSLEVDDPRLNHLDGRWNPPNGVTHSIDAENTSLAEARNKAKTKMGYDPGKYLYCRNGKMESPAEFGFIPIYDGSTPWVTLDIFSEEGIALMDTLVCNDDIRKHLDEHKVFYTNGTINPHTYNKAVLNAAFCGIDKREVPNPKESYSATYFTPDEVKRISTELIKDVTPDKDSFDKSGPGGWTRVLRSKQFELNKNERVMLAHNTWGLFNESDSLFLVFVVAQSITEAPEKVNPVGDWSENDDAITGERWAVALCWMDTSSEGGSDDLTREMDIIMFKYLNE